jgi:tRNA A-37 threonylcarbamoyl transferase component Bud32/Flp pilus assembly protein TadD
MDTRADRGATVLAGVALPPRYEPIRRIARGGMATVWCAQDRTLDRRVAIKLLDEPYAYDELAGRRFKREARAAARLSGHPNVVTIYDVGEAPAEDEPRGRPFLVMEHLSGGTVADALRSGTVDPVLALTWLQQAAAALDYAHRRGVIHRDVKLANFLLDRERVLHVADFGIAQLGSEDTLTVSGEVLGTAAYLAPERALGHPATEASDRYGLAVTAYELLVGERPFTAEHFAAQARQHVEEPPPLASRHNRELPPALDAVLTRGMAKHPEDRFPSSLAFTDAVEAALVSSAATRRMATELPTRRIPEPPASASVAPRRVDYGRRRPARRRIGVLAALAAVLLAVAIAAAASGGPGPSSSRASGHRTVASRPAARHSPTHKAAPAARPSTPATPTGTASTPAPAAPAPAPASGAGALEAQGHALMDSGNYKGAIPVLRQAVASATPNSLTYAYALFDLGRSLRLAGDPRAAVTILYKRLQIPNQTAVVQSELALALQALGQKASTPAGAAPRDHHGHGSGGPGQGD